MRSSTTVMLCDDHTLFREGIKAILAGEPSLEIIGEAENGREAVNLALELRPDVVLMDVSMPDLGGVEATKRILQANPRCKVVILTMYEQEDVIDRCLEAGASGYVLKDAPRGDLLHAIDIVRGGGRYLSSRALKKIVKRHVKHAKAGASSYERLSDREKEVLKLLADGLTLKEIAQRLTVSVKTADAHKTNMMRKLDLHDRSEVIKYAIQHGLIHLPRVETKHSPVGPGRRSA